MEPFVRTVQYYETDMMGVAHHANYIHWMEEARISFLDQLGFPYAAMEEKGVFSPVKAVSCDYKNPCTLDSVLLLPDRKNAIVYQPADDEGNVIIQLQGQKLSVRHNRLKLLVPAAQLYPPDYDFSIVFDTVANRKAAHTMDRKFDPDAVIIHREGTKEL